jgi:hypothetical protein
VQWSAAQITQESPITEVLVVLVVLVVLPTIIVQVHLWRESDVSNLDRCENERKDVYREAIAFAALEVNIRREGFNFIRNHCR